MTVKSSFKRKLTSLKYLYGNSAVEYFKNSPTCEECGEKRIAALTIHHKQGKSNNTDLQTLCFNCHMAHHHGNFTYDQEVLNEAKKLQEKENRIIRNAEIKLLHEKGISLRKIGKIVDLSGLRVWQILKN